MIRDEPRILNLLVHALLESLVEAIALLCNVVNIADLRLDADGELVTGIPRQSEALAVIGYQFECHIFPFCWFAYLVLGTKKPSVMLGWFVPLLLIRSGLLVTGGGFHFG
jgi:hypothetical protein